jgi:hypothetical protein
MCNWAFCCWCFRFELFVHCAVIRCLGWDCDWTFNPVPHRGYFTSHCMVLPICTANCAQTSCSMPQRASQTVADLQRFGPKSRSATAQCCRIAQSSVCANMLLMRYSRVKFQSLPENLFCLIGVSLTWLPLLHISVNFADRGQGRFWWFDQDQAGSMEQSSDSAHKFLNQFNWHCVSVSWIFNNAHCIVHGDGLLWVAFILYCVALSKVSLPLGPTNTYKLTLTLTLT